MNNAPRCYVTDYSEMLSQCKDRLFFYSPYSFIRDRDQDAIFVQTVLSPWLEKINRGAIIVRRILVENEPHLVLIEPLPWDTKHFGIPVHKILTVLYAHDSYGLLKKAMLQLASEISNDMDTFYFMQIPSEETYLIQAFCECGFRLTETRLHQTLSNVDSYSHERYQVRKAIEDDIENLRAVAMQMRNPWDRLHADIAFKQETADAYLATFIENSVRGFADLVLVPAEGAGPPDGFHTTSYPVKILDKSVARFGAVAVSNKTRRGWHMKLQSETIYALKDLGADYILLDTQASNRRANWVQAARGFTLAYVTHIFSKLVSSTRLQI